MSKRRNIKVKTQKPEKKILRKMKREYDEYEDTQHKSKTRKPRRGFKENFDDENDFIDYDDSY